MVPLIMWMLHYAITCYGVFERLKDYFNKFETIANLKNNNQTERDDLNAVELLWKRVTLLVVHIQRMLFFRN